jgi:predicted nucleotidyltransferase component of viral defense system
MIPPLLTRQQLELLNRRTLRYPLAIAEKDYFLALALTLIADSPLKDILVFKGGTTLHHCYLPQHRFSEDLDFSSLHRDVTMDDVVTVLQAGGLFTAKKTYTSAITLKVERLLYSGVLGYAGSIKVEIDQVQNVVLPPQQVTYQNVWHVPLTLPVMDIREVCAEKLRAACSGRATVIFMICT